MFKMMIVFFTVEYFNVFPKILCVVNSETFLYIDALKLLTEALKNIWNLSVLLLVNFSNAFFYGSKICSMLFLIFSSPAVLLLCGYIHKAMVNKFSGNLNFFGGSCQSYFTNCNAVISANRWVKIKVLSCISCIWRNEIRLTIIKWHNAQPRFFYIV